MSSTPKRPAAIWYKCTREAHNPLYGGMVDHCWVCMPWWGTYPVCTVCGRKLKIWRKNWMICTNPACKTKHERGNYNDAILLPQRREIEE